MLVSGILITLSDDVAAARGAVEVLGGRPGVILGEAGGRWVAAAVEAVDDAAIRELHGWIERCPGVAGVDVVFVDFGDPGTGSRGGVA